MKKFLICFFCLITSYAFSMDLSGVYDLYGSNDASGVTDYTGTVTISPQGANYRVDWQIGYQNQKGIAILCNDVLSVAYRNSSNGAMGVVSFFVNADGNLEGRWAGLGSSGYGTELLVYRGAY